MIGSMNTTTATRRNIRIMVSLRPSSLARDVCFLLLGLLYLGPVDGRFYPRQPFIDPACQHTRDCSWQFSSPDGTNLNQTCTIIDYTDRGALDGICPNPIAVPNSVDSRAAPVNRGDITVEEFSKEFDEKTTGDPETAGNYTCLRIKYQISEFVASKLKGIQFTLRGMNSADGGLYFCQNHKHGNDATEYYAVQDYVNQEYIPRVFTYECFCGIKPGANYDIIIRTLPIDYITNNDQHDTAVLLSYPRDALNPGLCSTKRHDKRCEWSKEAQWFPRCFHIKAAQAASEDSLFNVDMFFEEAPSEFGFDGFKAFVIAGDGKIVHGGPVFRGVSI